MGVCAHIQTSFDTIIKGLELHVLACWNRGCWLKVGLMVSCISQIYSEYELL